MYRKSDIEDINEAQEEGNYYDDQALADVQISELEDQVESLQHSITALISERNDLSKSLETMLRIVRDRVRWGENETAFAAETVGRAQGLLQRIGQYGFKSTNR